MAVALWLPWFDRQLSSVFAPIGTERSLSGWAALGGLGPIVLALAVVALAWGVLATVPRLAQQRQASAFWLVAAGGLALIIEVEAMVARIGAQDEGCCGGAVTTTRPALGLVLALAAAVVVVLVGIGALVAEARRRIRAA